jgi:iron complex transport system ATP-binding protein
MGSMKLEISHLACGYGNGAIIDDISFEMRAGEVVCLLGPNGSGKTTLLKAILGLLIPTRGKITLDGVDIRRLGRKELARHVAYLPQLHTPLFPYRVIDVVIMGRTAHLGAFSSPSRRDEEIAEAVLRSAGLEHLRNRPYVEISGGERQMVLICRALVQEARLLVMDEPTSSLDYGNQIRLLTRIRQLAAQGRGILMTTHIPNHAFLCADRCILMNNGRIEAVGHPHDVITEESLEKLYGVTTRIHPLQKHNGEDVRVCVPQIMPKAIA